MTWKWLLNGIYGFLPTVLQNLGITDELVQFLSNSQWAMPTVICINIWFGAPLIMVNVYAALQTIPQDQYEAAQIDGAKSWQAFIHITAPHIRTVVGLLVVLRTVWVFNNFDLVYMITAGGPAGSTMTMPLYIYDVGWTGRMVGKASAASILLLLFLVILCVVYFSVLNKWEKEEK
jgi:multiple sugar transport system permease protein